MQPLLDSVDDTNFDAIVNLVSDLLEKTQSHFNPTKARYF